MSQFFKYVSIACMWAAVLTAVVGLIVTGEVIFIVAILATIVMAVSVTKSMDD